MNRQSKALVGLLLAKTITLLIYTYLTVQHEGWNLLEVIRTNILSLNWSGQFNLDFICYLLLSGLWIMWRNRFSTASMAISIVAMTIGIMVFAPYLTYLIIREKGNLQRVLLGR
jgi:hypothetical protein